MIDLTPTTDRTRSIAEGVRDDQLDAPTPMPGTSVSELLNHLLGLTVAFRDAAAKLDGPTTSTPPAKVTEPLPDDWRTLLDARLAELAAAWRDDAAWDGMTKAGGVDLPGAIGGLVALDEVLLHGWDLARATGSALRADRRGGRGRAADRHPVRRRPGRSGPRGPLRARRGRARRRAGVRPGARAGRA